MLAYHKHLATYPNTLQNLLISWLQFRQYTHKYKSSTISQPRAECEGMYSYTQKLKVWFKVLLHVSMYTTWRSPGNLWFKNVWQLWEIICSLCDSTTVFISCFLWHNLLPVLYNSFYSWKHGGSNDISFAVRVVSLIRSHAIHLFLSIKQLPDHIPSRHGSLTCATVWFHLEDH